jgi:hypothetical protein
MSFFELALDMRFSARIVLRRAKHRYSNVATKLRCLDFCKVEMSLGSLAGSVSRRRGDHHIGAAPALAVGFGKRFGGFSDLQGPVL